MLKNGCYIYIYNLDVRRSDSTAWHKDIIADVALNFDKIIIAISTLDRPLLSQKIFAWKHILDLIWMKKSFNSKLYIQQNRFFLVQRYL